MVCRENKARSAVMAIQKTLCHAAGNGSMHDREFQSAIHERTHEFDGAPPMNREEQIAYWEGLKTQVEQYEHINDADKYRVSHKQPGIVTRLDQEIARLKTGKDENGHALTAKTQNSGAQLAAAQRLGSLMQRVQQSKNGYFEIHARHTGQSVNEVESQWNTLMDQERGGRGDVGISLKDDWKENAIGAGITTQMQADMGQSAGARDALATMERRRQGHVQQLESRPTIRDEHRTRFTSPGNAKIRCSGCGQFGHEEPDCPNRDLMRQRADIIQERVHYSELQSAAVIDDELTNTPDSELVAYGRDEHGIPDSDVVARGADARKLLERERDELLDGKEALPMASVQTKLAHLDKTDRDIESTLMARAPRVSSAISEWAYDPASGTLLVTSQPRRNKKTGQITPARQYTYRVPRDVNERALNAESVGAVLNATVWRKGRKGNNEGFRFENRADQEAALTQRRCPTCGQFATLNSSHTCEVPGSRSDGSYDRHRAAYAQWRKDKRHADADGQPAPHEPKPVRELMPGSSKRLQDGSELRLIRRREVDDTIGNGGVARAVTVLKSNGAQVEGTVTAWTDSDGMRHVSPISAAGGNGLRCSCADYRARYDCQHVKNATLAVAKEWGANPTNRPELVPGGPSRAQLEHNSDASFDAPNHELARMSYADIMNMRDNENEQSVAGLRSRRQAGQSMTTPRVAPPTGVDGHAVAWPTRWTRADTGDASESSGAGETVDLNDVRAVRYRIRAALYSQSGRYAKRGEKRKTFSVVANPDGSLRVSVPPSRRNPDGVALPDERRQLARQLGFSVDKVSQHGITIPPDPSWRAEFLDRSYGDEPRIRGARYVDEAYR